MHESATDLRRKFTGEPDAGNPHVRFDEGRGSRDGHHHASSPTLPRANQPTIRALGVRQKRGILVD